MESPDMQTGEGQLSPASSNLTRLGSEEAIFQVGPPAPATLWHSMRIRKKIAQVSPSQSPDSQNCQQLKLLCCIESLSLGVVYYASIAS